MKNLFKTTGAIFLLLLFFSSSSSADINQTLKNIDSKFLLKGKENLDPRVIYKIDMMGKELYNKTGVSVYLYAVNRYGKKDFSNMKEKISYIREFEKNITKNLTPPYALLTLSLDDTHVNILTSEDLKSIIDKDKILDRHIVPLLASKDKNSLYAKVSAAMLNGYASIVDEIAKNSGIELESSIGNAGAVASTIWRVFMYTIVVIGLLLYIYATLRARKK
jgi:hypothetical protein